MAEGQQHSGLIGAELFLQLQQLLMPLWQVGQTCQKHALGEKGFVFLEKY